MTDYKILQNIDLAQNEIKEVSKIANDRQDGEYKGLLIQTGDNTSLTFNRKIGGKENFIKGAVIDGAGEERKESVFTLEPSKVSISNVTTTTESKVVLGLNSETKEHIEAVSPLVDIKTGDKNYTDPHISLKRDDSILEIQSSTVKIDSRETPESESFEESSLKKSSLKMNEGITGVSNDIFLKSSKGNVYLRLESDGTDGTISEFANTSITEIVGEHTISLATDGIKIEDSTTSKTPSKIEVNNDGVYVNKGENSYVNIESGEIEENSNNITIKTPNNVTLTLDETGNYASLKSEGTITLTSLNGAKTSYEDNKIITEADTIIIKSKNYAETDEPDAKNATKYYPHIELKSSAIENSALIEGKTINIYSKDSSSGKEDTIDISGSTVNITDATTNIKTDTLNIIKSNNDTKILTLDTGTPKIDIPSGTETDINSQNIGLGDSDNNSKTTVSGDTFTVNTSTTSITSPTTEIIGTITLKIEDSSSVKNALVVNEDSTSITGTQADINPTTVNIGTDTTGTTNNIYIGKNSKDTTTLQSNTTSITSPTLSITSSKVNFGKNTNQTVTFEGTSGSSLISKVPTDIKNTTFSVKRKDSTDTEVEVFKVDTSKASPLTTTIKGTEANINPTTVNIGTDTTGTTNNIYIGKNSKDTTTLQSNITKIISPTIEIGTESTPTSVTIGKSDSSSNVTITGNNDLSITASDTDSKVQAKDLKFTNSLSDNNIKIYWDSALQSLVFARA